ncbi:MAG: hypothetical protein AB7O62_11315 [Pirellulales bacterium]
MADKTAPRNTTRHTIGRLLCLAALLAMAGCGSKPAELQTRYGKRQGLGAESSINGTATLGDMFMAAGHRVNSWFRLSPRLQEKADVIVWFPDAPGPPPEEVQEWFAEWLDGDAGRTLIYVPYDYDGEAQYWTQIRGSVSVEQQPLVDARLKRAETIRDNIHKSHKEPEDHGWFTLQPAEPRKADNFWGSESWLQDVDAAKVEIELGARMLLPDDNEDETEILLASGSDIIVARREVALGQVLCVVNASFLLNLPLVNHEHRKLASSLIKEVGSDKYVLFLEGSSEPGVDDEEPPQESHGLLELFSIDTLGIILLHLAVLGLIYAFWRFPIFGLPRSLKPESDTDFGQHVTALGQLLAKTGDRSYARSRLDHYQQAMSRTEPPAP